jgi:hypothetical protein
MIIMISLCKLVKGIIKMSIHVPNAHDICSCSACGKQQERYLFVTENDLYVCVQCWLSNANKYIANEKIEERVNEYRKSYFSSN